MQNLVTAYYFFLHGLRNSELSLQYFFKKTHHPTLYPFNLISNYQEQHFTIILGSCTLRKISLHQLIFNMQSIFLCNSKPYRKNDPSVKQAPWMLSDSRHCSGEGGNLGKHMGITCQSAPEVGASSVQHHPLRFSKLDSSFVLQIDPKISLSWHFPQIVPDSWSHSQEPAEQR